MGKKLQSKEEERQKLSSCTICMTRKTNAILNCSHQFCFRCIQKWSKKRQTCPICRHEILAIESGRRKVKFTSKVTQVTTPSTSYTFRPILMVPCVFYNYGWNYYLMNQYMAPRLLPSINSL